MRTACLRCSYQCPAWFAWTAWLRLHRRRSAAQNTCLVFKRQEEQQKRKRNRRERGTRKQQCNRPTKSSEERKTESRKKLLTVQVTKERVRGGCRSGRRHIIVTTLLPRLINHFLQASAFTATKISMKETRPQKYFCINKNLNNKKKIRHNDICAC